MDNPHEPLDAIKDWQTKYVLETSYQGPSITEDCFCDEEFEIKEQSIERATNNFADTIVDCITELTAAELYTCFLQAAKQHFEHVQREYDNAKNLMDIIQGKNNGHRKN